MLKFLILISNHQVDQPLIKFIPFIIINKTLLFLLFLLLVVIVAIIKTFYSMHQLIYTYTLNFL